MFQRNAARPCEKKCQFAFFRKSLLPTFANVRIRLSQLFVRELSR